MFNLIKLFSVNNEKQTHKKLPSSIKPPISNTFVELMNYFINHLMINC